MDEEKPSCPVLVPTEGTETSSQVSNGEEDSVVGSSSLSPVPVLNGEDGVVRSKEDVVGSLCPVPVLNGEESDGVSKEEGKVELSEELSAQIVRQVEYYFSDENLPTDKFMLKYVKKNNGFVPIGLIASFRKMKKLVKDDISIIVSALRTSTSLVVSSDGKKVKRSNPFNFNMKDNKLRTVLVENLAETSTEESIHKTFCGAGKIVNITIQDPQSEEGSMHVKKAMMTNKIHALVEYSSVEEAEKAVVMLNDRTNWRRGIRVELLNKKKGFGNFENFVTKDKDAEVGDGNKDDKKDHAGITKEYKGHNKNRRKFHIQKDVKELGSSSEITNKPLPGPRMPDGSKGFTMGRGKPLNFESITKEQEA